MSRRIGLSGSDRSWSRPAGTIVPYGIALNMALEVVPATVGRFDDVATVLGAGGGQACWCLYLRLISGEYDRVPDQPGKVRAPPMCRCGPSASVLSTDQGTAAFRPRRQPVEYQIRPPRTADPSPASGTGLLPSLSLTSCHLFRVRCRPELLDRPTRAFRYQARTQI